EVICQIKFPRALEIENRLPVDFQKDLTITYPLLETRDVVTIGIVPAAGEPSTFSRSALYEFLTLDRSCKIALTSEFVAVSTQVYNQWTDFRQHIERAPTAVQKHYAPSAFTRIGLRYVNVIERERLGLRRAPWRSLIRKSLLGVVGEKM